MFHFLCIYLMLIYMQNQFQIGIFMKQQLFQQIQNGLSCTLYFKATVICLKFKKGPFSIFQHILISVNARFSVVYFGVLYSVSSSSECTRCLNSFGSTSKRILFSHDLLGILWVFEGTSKPLLHWYIER